MHGMTRFTQLALGTTLAIALVGCGSVNKQPDEISGAIQTNSAVYHSFENGDVVAAWRSAEGERQSGDFLGAFKHLRKALQLDPMDPVIWSRLAEMALRLSKGVQSEKYALRSNELAAENMTLRYRNWLMLQRAREMNNDILGAEEAQKKARAFKP